MITPPEPVHPHDAAASAVVDGVATPEERALLEASPDGAQRVSAHRHVASLVGAPAQAQPNAAAEGSVLAALAVFGDEATVAPVVEITAPRRSKAVRWLAPAAAAAAALLLVVGIAGTLRSGGDATSSQAAWETSATAPAAADAGAALAGAAPTPAEGTASAPLDGGDVGSISDPAELAQRISEALDGAGSNEDTVRAGAQRSDVAACTAKAATLSPVPVTTLRYTAVGTYEGAKVLVLAYNRSDSSARILLVLDITACGLLTDQDF